MNQIEDLQNGRRRDGDDAVDSEAATVQKNFEEKVS